jgi:hypothetical protein
MRRPRQIVTGGLHAYSAATKEIGDADRQEPNNPAESSYLRSGGEKGHAAASKNEGVPKIQFMLKSSTISIRSAMASSPVYKQRRAVALAK